MFEVTVRSVTPVAMLCLLAVVSGIVLGIVILSLRRQRLNKNTLTKEVISIVVMFSTIIGGVLFFSMSRSPDPKPEALELIMSSSKIESVNSDINFIDTFLSGNETSGVFSGVYNNDLAVSGVINSKSAQCETRNIVFRDCSFVFDVFVNDSGDSVRLDEFSLNVKK